MYNTAKSLIDRGDQLAQEDSRNHIGRLRHLLKHPFQDRWGVWHYKEESFVEQVIKNYCDVVGAEFVDW